MGTQRIPALMVAASLVFLAAACSDNPIDINGPIKDGSLAIQTHTTGESLDLNGYLCQSELGEERMAPNQLMVTENVVEDIYTIRLADVAANCVVARNPIYAIVQPGQTTDVQFDVTCEEVEIADHTEDETCDGSQLQKGPC